MTTQIQRRRGTTTEHGSFTGAVGEITIDTTKDTVVVHDGSTAGGHPLAKENNPTFTGNMGIGLTSPGAPLAVASSGGINARLVGRDNGTVDEAQLYFMHNDNSTVHGIIEGKSTSLNLYGGTTLAQTITSSGNVGIGTSSPGYKIEVTEGSGNSVARFTGANSANLVLRNATSNVFELNAGGSNDELSFGTAGNNERIRIDSSGRLLVNGTAASGNNKLQVIDSDASIYGVTIGRGGGAVTGNIAVGSDALLFNSTGAQNTATGTQALRGNTTGNYNTANGYLALYSNTGSLNTAIGNRALYLNTTGTSNIGIGYGAGDAITTGSNNTIIGDIAGTTTLSNTVIIGAGSTERLRIDNSGRIGIGTTAPNATIDIKAGSPEVRLTATGASRAVISHSVAGLNFSQIGAANITFATNGSERMRIESTGRSMFTAPTAVTYIESAASAGTTHALITGAHSSGTVSLRVWTNGNIQNTNNSYGAISDAKLKENIVDASSQWDDIKDLRVRNYNFIEGQTHTQIGVVAQEVETVSPGLVTESPDLDAEGNDLGTTTKSVNYSVLYMKAVKALQEAMDRIETLETKVAALEAG